MVVDAILAITESTAERAVDADAIQVLVLEMEIPVFGLFLSFSSVAEITVDQVGTEAVNAAVQTTAVFGSSFFLSSAAEMAAVNMI